MFPLYRLGFTLLWNSYRVGLLFPFKSNNWALFSYRIAFTTQSFWKWYKIYWIGFTRVLVFLDTQSSALNHRSGPSAPTWKKKKIFQFALKSVLSTSSLWLFPSLSLSLPYPVGIDLLKVNYKSTITIWESVQSQQ